MDSSMCFDFKGKRALVTGAGKGIGREIAKFLSALGADTIALSRSEPDLVTLGQEAGCPYIVADLEDTEATKSAVTQAGNVDFLVNCAGISILNSFLETKMEDFDRMLAVNVRAVLIVSQVFARQIIARGVPGAIVNISSQASKIALANHTSYCTSKGAVDQLTRVMALELGPFQIRVNAVNPGITMTPMGKMAWSDPGKSGPMLARTPLARFAEPSDVAQTVAYLLSDYAAMITGVTLPVEGGFLIA